VTLSLHPPLGGVQPPRPLDQRVTLSLDSPLRETLRTLSENYQKQKEND